MSEIATVYVIESDPRDSKDLRALVRSIGFRLQVFSSAARFIERFDPNRPGCVVAFVRMPKLNALALQETLRSHDIQTPLIIVASHSDVPTAVQVMRFGAADFLEGPFDPQVLLERIHEAIARDVCMREERQHRAEIRRRMKRLTPREHEVFQLVVAGRANKEVAARLSVSQKTVEVHRAHVMRKLQAQTMAELVRMAILSESNTSRP